MIHPTLRQLEVLALVAEGKSDKAIGRTLSLTTRTVSDHLRNSYRKLGVHDRTHAVVLCIRAGLLR